MKAANFCVAAGVLLGAGFTEAAPIQWSSSSGGNNHYYEFVNSPNIKWTDAKVAAAARTFSGVRGYLTTITSADENAFMATNFPEEAGDFLNGWLGGYQDHSAAGYSEPAGGYRWVTGEAFAYTNWVPSEPDNAGGQDYIRSSVGFQWDDFGNDPSNPSLQYISGYFAEYSVPEPASLAVAALVALIAVRRRASTVA